MNLIDYIKTKYNSWFAADHCDPWPKRTPEWTSEMYSQLKAVEQNPKVTLQQLIEKSEQFPFEFPVESVKCKTLINTTPEQVLERNINSVYPVLHETALNLYLQFLEHKRNHGTAIEKELYQNMTLEMLVDRLLSKRAVTFVGLYDRHVLMDGVFRVGGWEKIGTLSEEEPLVLKNCISYDEMKLSALLSVSSYTQFINLGDRRNDGKVETDLDKLEPNGIIVGLIGARLGKPNVTEYQEIVVTKEQNVEENGYGDFSPPTIKNIFFKFYGEPCLTYDQLRNNLDRNKFRNIGRDQYFNNVMFKKRIALSIDTLLVEADARAAAAGKMAYVHVVGIGLGAWKISDHQEALFMDTFAERIEFLSSSLSHISDICFAHIKRLPCGKYRDGDVIPIEGHENNGIQIHIVDRDPHEKLKGQSEGKLLVVSYAWDGNALPGNDFWIQQLGTSGDPAAASSTQVAELHNPHINPRVRGANLRVATLTGLVTLEEYQQRIKNLHEKSLETKE